MSGPAISHSSLRLSANNVSCTVECSVKNGRDVTLTWYKGEERHNQTSSPDLSSNISLHLEMKDQDGNTYSCVAENPISNQTAKLNKTELCPGQWLFLSMSREADDKQLNMETLNPQFS